MDGGGLVRRTMCGRSGWRSMLVSAFQWMFRRLRVGSRRAGAIGGTSCTWGGGSTLAACGPPECPDGGSLSRPDDRASPLLVAEAGRCERWSLAGTDAGETGHGGPIASLPPIDPIRQRRPVV